MKKIICTFNLFDLHQNILLADGEDIRCVKVSNLDMLGEDIAMLCDKFDCNEVHLFGSAAYGEDIARHIVTANSSKYNNRLINVELN